MEFYNSSHFPVMNNHSQWMFFTFLCCLNSECSFSFEVLCETLLVFIYTILHLSSSNISKKKKNPATTLFFIHRSSNVIKWSANWKHTYSGIYVKCIVSSSFVCSWECMELKWSLFVSLRLELYLSVLRSIPPWRSVVSASSVWISIPVVMRNLVGKI